MPKTSSTPKAALPRRYTGGPVPYGLRVNEWGHWEVVEDEAKIIRQMSDWWWHESASYSAIAARLNAEGIPTPKGGDRWSAATVMRILQNPVYYRSEDPDTQESSSLDVEAIRAMKATYASGFLGDRPRPTKH